MLDRVMFDSHMHTPLCRHAHGEPEEYAARALEQGLRGIIFTCHSPMPEGFWPQVRMSEAEFDGYVAMVDRCRDAFAGELDVRLGLESDYFPGYEGWIEKLHQRAKFHHCLGSVHWQGPEYAEKFNPQDESAFRKVYWENLAASAETGLFDTLAHPDLIKNYRSSTWSFEECQDDLAAALDRIALTGVAMELNTSGLNKKYPEMNPGPQMLRMMCQRNIPVVIGSDSHSARRVGESFAIALELLRDAGYATVSVFEERKRNEIPISAALADLAVPQETFNRPCATLTR
ncbi:MAG: histidinol-phosphatase [Verrucomicrobia bacterium]|nr:histidinol-phosphatase [Verrucomicrobiota bacterium]